MTMGGAGYPWVLKTHVILMVIAWLFCAPVAILCARYLRRDWPGGTLLKQPDVWFQLHRLLNSLTVVLTILGTVAAFVYEGGYIVYNDSLTLLEMARRSHPVGGLVILCIMLVQVTIALLRPEAKSHWRSWFRISHLLLGRTMLILAVCSVYTGLCQAQAHWVSRGWWSAFIAAFILCHIVMEVVLTYLIRYNAGSSNEAGKEVGEEQQLIESPTGGMVSRLRRGMVASYTLIAFVVVITLTVSCAIIYTGDGWNDVDSSSDSDSRNDLRIPRQ